MATLLSQTPPLTAFENLESKLEQLLSEELVGLDTAAMVLAATGYPVEAGYDEAGGNGQHTPADGVKDTWL
ncbi:MAG: hypothetical protein ABI599_11135 [Flavobacteriales bacterium]